MKRIRTILVDDEKDSIEVLQILLSKYCPQVDIVGSANSVDEGIRLVNDLEPHLIFLDVEMPGKNGFELLASFPNKQFHTIMVTGYENYAIKAIKFSALDYILKPVDLHDLVNAVAKLNPEKMTTDPRLAHFSKLLEHDTKTYSSLMISTSSGFKNLVLDNILYVKAQSGNYSIFHLENGTKEIVSKPLSHFEELLDEKRFYRIHRSDLVNVDKVKSYDNSCGTVEMSTGEELTVSARRRSDFRKLMT